jgi:hypothetical protein
VPPDQQMLVALSRSMLPPVSSPVVMHGGMGGLISAHQDRFALLKQNNATVEMRSGCWSACTLITSYIPKDRLCFEKGAFLAFHAPRTAELYPRIHWHLTRVMYTSYPAEIHQWIDNRGGPDSLTIENFLTMYDRDLWAIGYPRCK